MHIDHAKVCSHNSIVISDNQPTTMYQSEEITKVIMLLGKKKHLEF